MSQLYEELKHEWFGHVISHFQDPSPTIAAGPQPAQGALMSLASIAADLRTRGEEAAASLRTALDEHLPQIEALGQLVDGNPVFASAQAASHVPLELLQGVATLLDTLAAGHPKPEAAPAAEAA